jgi:hypothetical protein
MLYSHTLLLTVAMAGVLREHGHKSWVAWALTAVICIAGFTFRFYHRRNRRR